MNVQLGDKVKDSVTSFEGIAVARTEWLHGCVRISVQPDKLTKEGKLQDTQTFDEPQLKIIKKAAVAGANPPTTGRTYGPRNDAAATSR